jgi:hypothetical protein
MAQMALISHVAFLKFKDDEDRTKKESDSVPNKGSTVPMKGKRLNADNAQAYMLIAGGILN